MIYIPPIKFDRAYHSWGGVDRWDIKRIRPELVGPWTHQFIEIAPDIRLKVYRSAAHHRVWCIEGEPGDRYSGVLSILSSHVEEKIPIEVEVVGPAQPSTLPDGSLDRYTVTVPGAWVGEDWKRQRLPHILVPIRVTDTEKGESAEGIVRVMWGSRGVADWGNLVRGKGVPIRMERFGLQQFYIYDLQHFFPFLFLLAGETDIDLAGATKKELWGYFLACAGHDELDEAPTKGIKSVFTKKAHKPVFERLKNEEPLLWRYLLWLLDEATRDKTTNNKLVKAFLEKTIPQGYEALRDALQESMDNADKVTEYRSPHTNKRIKYHTKDDPPENRSVCLHLPGAVEAEQTRKAKALWQYRQGLEGKADGMGMDPKRHPTLWKALLNEKIPLGIFHAPGKKEQIVNNEFDLWEAALSREGWYDPICAIAQDVSRRTTYHKPITPYLAFILWTLPRYLDRVAPRPDGSKWTCQPKFVESQWELEMEEGGGGTSKRRSALTPVADNETGVVTVPYVSMSITGVSTTYCYSGKYYLAEQGAVDPLNEAGGVWSSDYEEKLNGRDDYGLMFYTLIGTAKNTGYPTFLIILERLKRGTRVHFHRVHPNRSKKGIPTPTNQIIRECYRYMAGNVRAEEIVAQQGDLVFLQVDGPGHKTEDPKGILEFESHMFVPLEGSDPVSLVESLAKHPTNRLGYLYSRVPFAVKHPEHEDIPKLEAGWYEVRRCRSYENNPTAAWSYIVD